MAQQAASQRVTDPVCGMTIDSAGAAEHREYEERTYFFCSAACLAQFDAEPARYASAATGPDGDPGTGGRA